MRRVQPYACWLVNKKCWTTLIPVNFNLKRNDKTNTRIIEIPQKSRKKRLGRHPVSWAFHRSSGPNSNYYVTIKALTDFRVPLAPNWDRFGTIF